MQDRRAVVELEHELLRVGAVPVGEGRGIWGGVLLVFFFFDECRECCFVFPFSFLLSKKPSFRFRSLFSFSHKMPTSRSASRNSEAHD